MHNDCYLYRNQEDVLWNLLNKRNNQLEIQTRYCWHTTSNDYQWQTHCIMYTQYPWIGNWASLIFTEFCAFCTKTTVGIVFPHKKYYQHCMTVQTVNFCTHCRHMYSVCSVLAGSWHHQCLLLENEYTSKEHKLIVILYFQSGLAATASPASGSERSGSTLVWWSQCFFPVES